MERVFVDRLEYFWIGTLGRHDHHGHCTWIFVCHVVSFGAVKRGVKWSLQKTKALVTHLNPKIPFPTNIVFFFHPLFFPKFLFLQIYSVFFISSPFIPLSLGDVRPPPKKHRSLDESNDQESELGLFCDLRPASCCI